MPGPAVVQGPVASTSKHISGYVVCGSFTAPAGRSSFSCPLPAGAVGPYRLLLYNGNPDGTARAESATIRVNGRPVLDHDDFDEKVSAATAQVVLAASNTIDVRIEERRAQVRFEIVDEGQTCSILGPSLVSEANSPFATSFPSKNAFPVPELQLFNGFPAGMRKVEKGSVSLNGATVLPRKQFHEQMSAFLASVSVAGTNKLVAVAGEVQGRDKDKKERRGEKVRRQYAVQIVDRDKTPPSFSIASRGDGSYTNRPQLVLSGPIDDSSAQVSIGSALGSIASGRYSAQATLRECWNTITVHAADVCGNSSEAFVRVGLDTVPPVLAIVSPASGLVTNQPQQPVTLRYSDNFSGFDPSSVLLLLDGTDITTTLAVAGDAATGTLNLPEGRHLLHAEVRDRAGNATTQEAALLIDLTPPALAIVAPKDGSTSSQSPIAIDVSYADPLSGVDPTSFAASVDGKDVTRVFAVGSMSATARLPVPPGRHDLEVRIADRAGNVAIARSSFSVSTLLPPDPKTVAPALDRTVATTLADATSFLYTGPNPIQTGVAPGTIEPRRASVLRGSVHSRAGDPLPGATVTVLGHAEFGATLTRDDGRYDLAVNGGGPLLVKVHAAGYLDAQRSAEPAWGDYALVPDLVLVALDPVATPIDLGGNIDTQVGRGTVSQDGLGPRQATVLFPPGTSATMELPDGTTRPLPLMHFRATEYTVGETGPRAMPAPLPPASAYTYAVAFTADEAVALNATAVRFSQPVFAYVENFLQIPVGKIVPAGYYDPQRGVWVPSSNGVVLRILSVTNGLADIDADGDGIADTAAQLAARGLSASERARLASLYLPGQSLWRVPLQHFSSDDFNFSGTAPFGAHPADTPKPTEPKAVQGPVQCPGSIVEVENQVLGERLDLPGTPCSLNYRSDRVRGRHANHRLDVPIPAQFDITLPPNVICDPSATPACQRQSSPRFTVTPTVTVSIAGRSFSNTASAAPAVWKFEWDGLDAYGRRLQGEHPITIQACNNYPLVDYFDPDTDLQALANSFGSVSASNQVMLRRLTGFTYGTYGFTGGVSLCSSWQGKLGGWDAQPQGLGGWTLSAQHSYDPTSATLYFGNGEHQTAHDLNQLVMNPFAGKPEESWLTNLATAVMVAPDGSLYFSDFSQVFKIAVDGTRTVIAGRIIPPYPIGDEGPATDAYLLYPSGLALGPEGSLYIMDTGNNRIRRVTPDGIIHTVAGTGVDESAQAFTADGVLAVNASLQLGATGYQEGIVVTPDGALIFSETTANRVRKIGPDGILRTVAGTGSAGFGGDGGPALQGSLNSPAGLALAKDGTLYIADAYNFRVRKVTPSGIISTVLTNPCGYNFVCSNYVRNEPILALAIAPDDTLFVGNGVRGLERVRPDGSHSRVAGNNTATTCTGKDCPALSILFWPRGVALAPDGSLFLSSDSYTPARVVRVSGSVAAATAADTAVASRDGSEVYQFDGQGRHVRTVDALTGVVKDRFAYGSTGLLASVTDESGNVTTVERDGQGNATAIVGPYGQRTSLALDSNGYLASVVNPAGEAVYLQSTGDGLLTQLTDPRGGVHTFQHDVDGFLLKDQDPAGGFQSFDRHGQLDAASVTRQTALGRTSNDQTTLAPAGDAEARMATDAALLSSTTKRNPDYSQSEAGPDGTVASLQLSPDPRFGMDAPLTGVASVRTPGGLTLATTTTRTVSLLDTNNPLNFASLTTSVATNGQAFSSTYDRASSTITSTTPAGRHAVTTLDALGRVAQVQAPGVLPVRVQYDSRGRPFSVTQGSRVVSYVYDAQGNLASLTDPLGRQVSFAYDLAGRPTRQVLPDGRTISLAYDASGNVTSVTPPGRPAHSFAYTPVDLEQSYSPPNLGFQSTTQTSYDLDRQVTLVSRPAGDSIVPSYDTAGRLASLTTSAGATRVTYDPTSGHLAQLTAPGGVGLTYVYDGALLTDTSWAGPISGTLHRSYDNFFRVATESVSGGQPISYHYDPDGLLTSAGALQIQRDPATGFVTGSSLGGITEARAYDAYGAEASYTASAGSSSLYSVTYTRDALGRIASKTERVGADAAHTFSYGYDLAGRLSDVAKDGTPTAHYTYDANGNRTAGPGLTASPVYDAQDRMLAYGACSYTYKASGELQTKTCPDGTTTYDYDALGNLRHVALPNQTQIDYVVDGQNRRIGKKVNGVLVEGFLYRNQLQPSAWLDATGAVKATFAYGLHANVPEYMVQGTTTYRLITDKVGSVRLIVDTSTGAVAERVDYDEFGSVLADSAPGMQPFGFAGGIRDHDTGLVRFGARDYCPITGRWTNKEPLGFNGSLNFYQYVDGDPVNVKDPTGLAKVGDVVFFNWYGQKFPEHAAIVTDVDGAGNPTHAFGGWEDTMTFHDVDLSSYKLGITDNIIGTGDMTGLHSLSLSDFEAAWDGTAVAPDWDGTRGNVCIDATTGKGSYGGAILRSAMAADFNKHPKSYKNYGAGNADPRSRFFYRRNPWLWQFFKNTGRLH